MKMRIAVSAATVFLALGIAAGALFLSGALTSRAVQNPSFSIDMITTGNSYTPGADADLNGIPDPGTNTMTVGTIDSSSTSGSAVNHTHLVQIVVQNVEDPVSSPARAN